MTSPVGTNSRSLCNHPTLILWTSSAQVCLLFAASIKYVMYLNHMAHFFHLGCFAITTVFSHAQTVVVCFSCTSVLCQPTGGKTRLTEGVLPSCFIPTHLLTYSGFQVALSVERTDLISWQHCHFIEPEISPHLMSITRIHSRMFYSHYLFSHHFSSRPCCMDPSDST